MRPIRKVLFLTLDQWRADCLGAMGHPVLKTPNLDRLAEAGTLFRRHFGQTIPCGPSRASILTGRYLHNHRSVANGTPLAAHYPTLPKTVRAAGLEPWLIGYTDTTPDPTDLAADDPALTSYEGVMPGFRVWLNCREDMAPWLTWLRARGYDLPAAGMEAGFRPADASAVEDPRGPTFAPMQMTAEETPSAYLVDEAIRFLEAERDHPWLLHLSILAPHPPRRAPAPYNALYDPADGPEFRRAASADDQGDIHPFYRYLIDQYPAARDMPEAHLRQLRATYWGMIAEADHHVGRLLAALDRLNLNDEVLIVATSDHGELLGDHWLLDKRGPFDASFHVPLIVRHPDLPGGRVVDRFTENVDILPTLLEALGATPPSGLDGRSLMPLVAGDEPAAWREAAHWEVDFRDVVGAAPEQALGLGGESCNFAVRRTDRFKCVHFADLPPLLFDVEADPSECRNLAEDPGYREVLLAETQALLSWRLRSEERSFSGMLVTPGGLREMQAERRF